VPHSCCQVSLVPSLHQHQRIINASTFHRPSSAPKQYRGASSRRLGWLRAPSASLTTRSPSTPLAGPARTRTTQRPHRARWCPRWAAQVVPVWC